MIEEESNAKEGVETKDTNEIKESISLVEMPAKEEPQLKTGVEEKNVSLPITPVETSTTADLPIESKSRLNSHGHLDLKFYHSSLW